MASLPLSSTEQATQRLTTFPFLELPAEIRNDIYLHDLKDGFDKEYNLAKLSMPAIARVNQQLRNESLAIFFSKCSFYLEIDSNIQQHYMHRVNVFKDNKDAKSRRQRSGLLKMKSQVNAVFRESPHDIKIRNVTFVIFEIEKRLIHTYWRRDPYVKVVTRYQVASDEVHISSRKNELSPPLFKPDIDELVLQAVRVIQEILEVDGFKGFTLAHLRTIAKVFRFVPEPETTEDDKAFEIFRKCLVPKNGRRPVQHGTQAIPKKKVQTRK